MLTLNYGMVKFTEFYDHILPEIPGAILSLVDQQIRSAAIDYCIATRVWQETVEDVTVSGESQYSLDYPNDAIFYEPREVLIDDKPITPFAPEQLTLQVPSWRTETGVVVNYTVVDESSIFLYRIPDSDGQTIKVDAVFLPSQDSTRVPDFFINRPHHDAILALAKSSLMYMGRKPWTDRELALKYEQDANALMGGAAFRIAQGKTRLPARVTNCHGVK